MNMPQITSIRPFVALMCLILPVLSEFGCRDPIEKGKSRSGEIKDYAARVTVIFPDDLVSRSIWAGQEPCHIGYALIVNDKAVCDNNKLYFGDPASATFDLTPYLYKGTNSARMVVALNVRYPRDGLSNYIGSTNRRIPVLQVEILRGNQVTYRQTVDALFTVIPYEGDAKKGHASCDDIDQSTLSFTFEAQ